MGHNILGPRNAKGEEHTEEWGWGGPTCVEGPAWGCRDRMRRVTSYGIGGLAEVKGLLLQR